MGVGQGKRGGDDQALCEGMGGGARETRRVEGVTEREEYGVADGQPAGTKREGDNGMLLADVSAIEERGRGMDGTEGGGASAGVCGRVSACRVVQLLAWVAKALAMRGHPRTSQLLHVLLYSAVAEAGAEAGAQDGDTDIDTGTGTGEQGCDNGDGGSGSGSSRGGEGWRVSREAVRGFACVLEDREDCLNAATHAVVRPLYKQRLWAALLPALTLALTHSQVHAHRHAQPHSQANLQLNSQPHSQAWASLQAAAPSSLASVATERAAACAASLPPPCPPAGHVPRPPGGGAGAAAPPAAAAAATSTEAGDEASGGRRWETQPGCVNRCV